jgi:hypothetical protein
MPSTLQRRASRNQVGKPDSGGLHGRQPRRLSRSTACAPCSYSSPSVCAKHSLVTAPLTILQGGMSAGRAGRPTVQRIVVASSAASQAAERLHDSYSEIDYTSPYKHRR